MTAGEQSFVDQMTRKKMTKWCHVAVLNGDSTFTMCHANTDPFVQYALTKKWISAVKNVDDDYTYRILSGGWDTATRFLKR